MIDLSNLRNITEQKTNDAVAQRRHSELLLDNTETQEIIVKSISKLVDFLDKKTTKTEVVNQLRSIGTPDVNKVVTAVDSLHSTLKTHENTDLSGVTKVLTDLLEEAKSIPKSLPEFDIPTPVDYSKQLTSLENTVKAVEKAIQGLELEVEAPIVNVPETQVNVEAPNLKPIEQSISSSSKDVVKAVNAIKIPELNTDPVEKLLKKTNKLLEELPELMPKGGGGGGGRATPYQDANDMPAFVELTPQGRIPVDQPNLATRLDDAGDPIIYVGKAPIGSATSSAVWQISKLDVSSGLIKTWADGDADFNNIWDNITTITYS